MTCPGTRSTACRYEAEEEGKESWATSPLSWCSGSPPLQEDRIQRRKNKQINKASHYTRASCLYPFLKPLKLWWKLIQQLIKRELSTNNPHRHAGHPLEPENSKAHFFFKRKGRWGVGTADWQGLKRDTISWWPDGRVDKMLFGSWDLIGFSVYRWAGKQHTSADFLTDIWIFLRLLCGVCELTHTQMCEFTFLFERLSDQTCPYTSSPVWTNRGGTFMRFGCLPWLLLTVSLKRVAHYITPFAGHMQRYWVAAMASAQDKPWEIDTVLSTAKLKHQF